MIGALREELYNFASKLAEKEINVIIAGGYGLLLKTEHIIKTNPRTLISAIPGARSTNDLDVFLSTEIITELSKMAAIRQVLDEMGYHPINSAKYYQFARDLEFEGRLYDVKIDFLSREIYGSQQRLVVQDERRIRPRIGRNQRAVDLHGHTTPEAYSIEEYLLELELTTKTNLSPVKVYLPHPFSYLLLKLFTVRDHLTNARKLELGRAGYHSFDIYRTICMVTENEWQQSQLLREKMLTESNESKQLIEEAKNIVVELFNDINSLAMVKLQEHVRETKEIVASTSYQEFLQHLKAILAIETP